MKYLLFSGSLREASLNKKLALAAQNILSLSKTNETKFVDIKSLNIPVYDGDLEEKNFPEGVRHLGEMMKQADALVIATPEYNGFMAGSLKNLVDWVSRLKPLPLEKKSILLLGASPGAFGAIRGLTYSKVTFEHLGNYVYPQIFALPKAHEAFAADGSLSDVATQKKLADLLVGFEDFASKLK